MTKYLFQFYGLICGLAAMLESKNADSLLRAEASGKSEPDPLTSRERKEKVQKLYSTYERKNRK